MKKMQLEFAKNLRFIGLAILTTAMTLTYTGCKTEGCTDPTATNYDDKADDDDGSCTYERDALIGSYTVSGTIACGVTGGGTVSGSSLTITESTASTSKIVVAVFDVSLTCTVAGSSFTIDNQTISGFDYTGNGNVSGNTINVTVNEFDNSIPETCVYTLNGSRQ
ncbi:MAG: hypothetical protein WED33_10435 [Bacteroidia bacterium]